MYIFLSRFIVVCCHLAKLGLTFITQFTSFEQACKHIFCRIQPQECRTSSQTQRNKVEFHLTEYKQAAICWLSNRLLRQLLQEN